MKTLDVASVLMCQHVKADGVPPISFPRTHTHGPPRLDYRSSSPGIAPVQAAAKTLRLLPSKTIFTSIRVLD